jgi:NADH-quinone oxidoreductase subunit J
MEIQSALFYLFSALVLSSGLMIVIGRNPVHSVLLLIFAFFNAAGLFVLLGAEYLAMTLVIVYVGAVAILFLFVVMMLDINVAEIKQGFVRYLPIGAAMGFAVALMLLTLIQHGLVDVVGTPMGNLPIPDPQKTTNAVAIGQVLYTEYVYAFQVAGLVLFVAMVGAIVLTLRHRKDVRRQNVMQQLARKPKDCVSLVDVETGKGV